MDGVARGALHCSFLVLNSILIVGNSRWTPAQRGRGAPHYGQTEGENHAEGPSHGNNVHLIMIKLQTMTV